MCVICKQARKTGRAWAGMTGAPPPMAQAVWLPPLTSKGTARTKPAPVLRYGKGAYVTATAFVAGGPCVTDVRPLMPYTVCARATVACCNPCKRIMLPMAAPL